MKVHKFQRKNVNNLSESRKYKKFIAPLNDTPLERITKKRKKKKSVIFKPHRYLKKNNKELFRKNSSEDSLLSNISVKPSSSETNICDKFTESEIKSEYSESIDMVKSDCTHRHNVFNVSSFFEKTSESSEDLHNSKNEVVDFFDMSSLEDYSCAGDINDIMYGGNCRESESNFDVEGYTSEETDTKNDEEFDDTLDLRLNDLLKTETNSEEIGSEHCEPGFKIYKDDTNYIVVLKYSETICVFGYSSLKILFGKVNVLGYSLTSKSPEYIIYSPKGTSLIVVKNTSKFCHDEKRIKSIVQNLSNHSLLKDVTVRKDSSIMLFSKTKDFKLNLLESHISQKILPLKTVNPCIEIEPKGSWNTITISEEWDTIVKNITGQSKVLICGGKGVGKSTFLRYAINCLIQKYDHVRVVDLDPGQAEFTVPGSISVITLTEPLLGVNYTHLKKTERSILCDINISQDPHKYICCVEVLKNFEMTTHMDHTPTLINFMGYNNDLAFHLLSSVIYILQPDKIVYIKSINKKKNFKIEMNKENILKHCELFQPNFEKRIDIEVLEISSKTDENTGWSLEARQVREMCILAYFGQSMDEDTYTLQHYKLPMYEVQLLNVQVTDRNNLKVQLDGINGNIVALCALADEEKTIFQCFGWAIVRAVDFIIRTATIITPIDEETLDKVTHLVAGCLTLPPSIYMNHESVQGQVPYVMEGVLIDFAQMTKRTHIPRNVSSNKKNTF